jgi:hypothetical protein
MKRPKVRPSGSTMDPVNYERDIAPFTRSSENLLREIRQELSTIPEYRNTASIAGKSTREPTRVDPLFDMITALKRGIRSVQGKESKSSLQDRERKLENIIRKAQEYQGAALMRTPGGGRATLVTGLRPDEMSKGGRAEIKGNKFKGTF